MSELQPEIEIDFSNMSQCKDIAEGLSAQAGVVIPGDINLAFWQLPILAALLKRVQHLEKDIANLKKPIITRDH